MNDIVEKRYSELLNKPKNISFIRDGLLDPEGEKILLKNLDVKYCNLVAYVIGFYALLASVITYPVTFYVFSMFRLPYNFTSPSLSFFIVNVIITTFVTFLFLHKKNNLIAKTINKMIKESPEEIKKQINQNIHS